MAISVQCPGCRQRYNVADAMAGRTATCKKCGLSFPVKALGSQDTAPLPELSAADLLPAAPSKPAAPPKKPPKKEELGLAAGLAAQMQAAQAPTGYPPGIPGGPLSQGMPIAQPPANGGSVMVWFVVGGTVALLILGGMGYGAYAIFQKFRGGNNNVASVPAAQSRPRDAAPTSGNTTPSSKPATFPQTGVPGANPQPAGNNTGATSSRPGTAPPTPPPAPPAQKAPEQGGFAPGSGFDEQSTAHYVEAWTLKPDPPAEVFTFPKGKKISVPLGSSGHVFFPATPSPFVMLTADSFEGGGAAMIDLRTPGKPVHQFQAKLEYREPCAVSADGLYFAAQARTSGATIVNLWSFAEGKLLTELPIGEHAQLKDMAFCGTDQLLVLSKDHNVVKLSLWNLKEFRKDQEMRLPGDCEENALAISPGMKYAAVALAHHAIEVYEIAKGERVGALRFPAPSERHQRYRCLGLAFSDNGKELAVLLEDWNRWQVYCWECERGELMVEHQYEKFDMDRVPGVALYTGRKIQWLPEGDGWVFGGHILVDRRSGTPVWKIPETDREPRKMLSVDRLLLLAKDRNGKHVLTTADLPSSELAKALETVRAGGKAVDALFPPLTKVDLAALTPGHIPEGSVDWKVQPDGITSTAPMPGAGTQICRDRIHLHGAMFATGAPKIITHKSGEGARGKGRVFGLTQLSLGASKTEKEIELPFEKLDLVAVSPSGNLAVTVLQKQQQLHRDRLDVWSFESKKHVAGMRPYQNPANERDEEITLARFAGEDRLLTVNHGGKLVAWKLPELQPQYVLEEVGKPLDLSAMGKYLATVKDKVIYFLDTATGQVAGKLETEDTAQDVSAGAFRRDGKAFAAVLHVENYRYFIVWDLTTGERLEEFPTPGVSHLTSFGQLEWYGERYLLYDRRYLVDVQNRAIVWQYHYAVNTTPLSAPDGRLWMHAPQQGSFAGSRYLTAVEIPTLMASTDAANVTLETQALLSPGVKVSVTANVTADTALSQAAVQALTNSLRANGCTVDPSAPLRLTLAASEQSTGEQLQVTSFGFGFGRRGVGGQLIQQTAIVFLLQLTDARGQTRWENRWSLPMRSYGTISSDGDPAAILRQEMYAALPGAVQNLRVPRYVFPKFEDLNLGASTLGITGEGPPPPKPQPNQQMPGGGPGGLPGGGPGGIPAGLPGGIPGGVPRFPAQ